MRRAHAIARLLAASALGGCLLAIDPLPPPANEGAADGGELEASVADVVPTNPEAGPVADADAAAVPLDPDLVGAWSFDEGSGSVARDLTANHNDGTLTSGASWVAGHQGGGVSFDGVTGRVLVPAAASLETIGPAMTWAAWLYVIGGLDSQPRLTQMGDVWDIKLNGAEPQLSASPQYAIVDTKIPLHEWHHVALRFDRGTLTGFIDGVAKGLSTNAFTNTDPLPKNPSMGLSLGGVMPGNTDPSCNCILDEVRLFRRALDAAEIAQLAR